MTMRANSEYRSRDLVEMIAKRDSTAEPAPQELDVALTRLVSSSDDEVETTEGYLEVRTGSVYKVVGYNWLQNHTMNLGLTGWTTNTTGSGSLEWSTLITLE